MNTMTYNGYHARIEFDAEDEVFFGKIAGISDVIGFHGDRSLNSRKPSMRQSITTSRPAGKSAKSLSDPILGR